MSWSGKFSKLFYVAYLDCENALRVLAFITIGVVIGLASVIYGVAYLPPDYPFFAVLLVEITLWNLGIILIWAFQFFVSLIFCWSMLKVAYMYDDKVWGSVHGTHGLISSLDAQLKADVIDKQQLKQKHEDMLKEKIQKIKE